MPAEREVQPMVLDISDGLLKKIVLNRSGPFTDTGPPLGTRLYVNVQTYLVFALFLVLHPVLVSFHPVCTGRNPVEEPRPH